MSPRRELPAGALPVRKGQEWRDRDRRSPFIVTVLTVDPESIGFVYYQRGRLRYRSRTARFVRAFDFVRNPDAPSLPHGDTAESRPDDT